MGLLNKSRGQCREFHIRLEDAANVAPGDFRKVRNP